MGLALHKVEACRTLVRLLLSSCFLWLAEVAWWDMVILHVRMCSAAFKGLDINTMRGYLLHLCNSVLPGSLLEPGRWFCVCGSPPGLRCQMDHLLPG